jgi:hypothetical protein
MFNWVERQDSNLRHTHAKVRDISMNPLVKELHNYLRENGVVIRGDAPGEFGADTLAKLIEYMEKLKEGALTEKTPYPRGDDTIKVKMP